MSMNLILCQTDWMISPSSLFDKFILFNLVSLMWSSDDAGNFIICIKLMCLTSDTQPALSWLTSSRDSALVGSFIKLGDTGDDHVSFIAGPDVGAMFVEISYVTCGIVLLSTAESHSVSLSHRVDGNIQDHSTSWSICEKHISLLWSGIKNTSSSLLL